MRASACLTTFARLSEQTNQSAEATSGETVTSASSRSTSSGRPIVSRSSAGTSAGSIDPPGPRTSASSSGLHGRAARVRSSASASASPATGRVAPRARAARRPRELRRGRARAAQRAAALLFLGQQQPAPRRVDGVRLAADLPRRRARSAARPTAANTADQSAASSRVSRLVHDGTHRPAGDRHRRCQRSAERGASGWPWSSTSAPGPTYESDLEPRVAEQVAQSVA